MSKILNNIKGLKHKGLAILIDPDKVNEASLNDLIINAIRAKVDLFLVGGSLISSDNMDMVLSKLNDVKNIPNVLFPGNSLHVNSKSDGILLLSLLSGRNPDFLIGQHVLSAPALKRSNLEILPTAYLLVDGGKQTTASYISNTTPIPNDKADIAVATAMAGEMLGLKLTYLDAGSGAQTPVSLEMIEAVKANIETPLIVGGGINTIEKAKSAYQAGADIIVVGNATEKDPNFIMELGALKKELSTQKTI
ncbi:geranylgeranylglyceryl/heptaprenylglyceryl phosphate synthase [uncultured Arcticibacterium sp.]|uniref:geranylgeranylglyceryl/heptaprenylglyceryl phosphate synthase n=1 Tax=uncultured Arcticibacterium sp. TaxID=2173042 RepID=UPI0030F97887